MKTEMHNGICVHRKLCEYHLVVFKDFHLLTQSGINADKHLSHTHEELITQRLIPSDTDFFGVKYLQQTSLQKREKYDLYKASNLVLVIKIE